MLYRVGVFVLLLAMAFSGGSPIVPGVMVLVGVLLMKAGKRREANYEEGDAEQ